MLVVSIWFEDFLIHFCWFLFRSYSSWPSKQSISIQSFLVVFSCSIGHYFTMWVIELNSKLPILNEIISILDDCCFNHIPNHPFDLRNEVVEAHQREYVCGEKFFKFYPSLYRTFLPWHDVLIGRPWKFDYNSFWLSTLLSAELCKNKAQINKMENLYFFLWFIKMLLSGHLILLQLNFIQIAIYNTSLAVWHYHLMWNKQ